MIDWIAIIGGAVIKEVIAQGVQRAKGRQKPKPKVVEEKVEKLVDQATEKALKREGAELEPEQKQSLKESFTRLVAPTFEEMVKFYARAGTPSPCTMRSCHVGAFSVSSALSSCAI